MQFVVRWAKVVALAGVCVCVGCSSETGPKLVPAKGKVLRDGKPLAKVVLQFIPDKGPMSVSQTNDAGEFTLYGPSGKEGALPGKFKVTVTCPFNPAAGSSASGQAPTEATAPCELPAKYSVPDTTDLSVEIPATGKTDLVIEVPSA